MNTLKVCTNGERMLLHSVNGGEHPMHAQKHRSTNEQ